MRLGGLVWDGGLTRERQRRHQCSLCIAARGLVLDGGVRRESFQELEERGMWVPSLSDQQLSEHSSWIGFFGSQGLRG